MNKWSAYALVEGEDFSRYYTVEFDVPDHLYDKIMGASMADKLLCKCSFYDDIIKIAKEKLAEVADEDYRQLNYGDNPKKEDFATEAEWFEAGKERWSYRAFDDWSIAWISLFDASEEGLFRNALIGRKVPEYATGEPHTEGLEYDYDFGFRALFNVTVHFDKDGMITDLTDICQKVYDEDSGWSDCDPDYDMLRDFLRSDFWNYCFAYYYEERVMTNE